MRTIYLEDDLRLRFPGRDDEFAEGFEVGMIAMLMSLGQAEISRRLSEESLEQAEVLALKLGYHLAERHQLDNGVEVTFRLGRARPKLRLVHSREDDVPASVSG